MKVPIYIYILSLIRDSLHRNKSILLQGVIATSNLAFTRSGRWLANGNMKSPTQLAGYISPVALLISLYFPPEIGGGSTGAWNRALSLQKLGFMVFVLCGFPAYPSGKITEKKYRWRIISFEKSEEINVIRIRLPTISYKGYLRRLILFVSFMLLTLLYAPAILSRTGRLSLVYARSPVIFSNVPGFCYSKFQKSFYIYEAPDLWPEELSVFHSPIMPLLQKIGRLMARVSYRSPDVVVTVSSSAMEYIRKNYTPTTPVFGIPVGVNPNNFDQIKQSDALHELISLGVIPAGLDGKFLVVYSGRISPAQNVPVLIGVAKKLETCEDIAFLIVGDGEDRGRLQELTIENGLQNLYIIGQQPRMLMPLILGAANLCAITLSEEDIFNIALPTKFFEYVASSKPIIGICRGELADLVESHDVGYVFRSLHDIDKIAEIIKYLKESPQKYAELQRRCKAATTEFSIDMISLKFKDVLEKYDNNRISS